MALISQYSAVLNDAVKDALGTNATLSTLDSSDVVSLGKALANYDAYEGFYKSLANRIVKTLYFIRSYEAEKRSILRDESEYGAFVQKVYYETPDNVDNPTFAIPNSSNEYKQASPFDVENVVKVTSLIYGNQGTWSIEVIRPAEQVKTAFLSADAMDAFISGIYMEVNNKMELDEERLVALAANTSMAACINTTGHAINLLTEYKAIHTGATVTAATCMSDKEFLRYAAKRIRDTIKYMGRMSKLFNVDKYETFTSRENMVVEVLTEFASAMTTYLESDTFHKELVALPRYEEVAYWQGSGASFAFADTSKIHVKHDDLVTGTNTTGIVEQSGIICFLHDIENVAAYFGNRSSWEMWNPRSEVAIHGEKARKGYAVDNHANAIVFYVADAA